MFYSISLLGTVLGGLGFVPTIYASPLIFSSKHALSNSTLSSGSTSVKLALDTDFPDPSFIQHTDGTWYAFGTNGNGHRIQVANSTDFMNWSLLDIEALPNLSSWENEPDHWAPDVFRRDDGRYVMYYSAVLQSNPYRHCIGVAIADGDKPAGPYVPTSTTPIACPIDQGGAIDASSFQDTDDTRYILYKIDGNSIGHGGDCNNGVEPLVATPIMLQEVLEDGITPVGEPIKILDRDESDGPLVEAPSLVRSDDGTYLLFYSTHCFTSELYDTRLATASSIKGPYVKKDISVLESKDQFHGPGGATIAHDGGMLFHGWCQNGSARCMYAAQVDISGGVAAVE